MAEIIRSRTITRSASLSFPRQRELTVNLHTGGRFEFVTNGDTKFWTDTDIGAELHAVLTDLLTEAGVYPCVKCPVCDTVL